MTWKFHVHATEHRRLLSRILQVLDSQMVGIRFFTAETSHAGVHVSFEISSEEDKAYRIEALLYKLQDVHAVSIQDMAWSVVPSSEMH